MTRLATPPKTRALSWRAVSPQFNLLCACAGPNPSSDTLDRVCDFNAATLDWQHLMLAAESHGVIPLLARNLLQNDAALPAEFLAALRTAFETNARKNLWFSGELVRIVRHLQSAGIQTIPYKGPLLAQLVYGDIALRSFGDLDLLVRAGQYFDAQQALHHLEYVPSKDGRLTPDQFLKTGYEQAFDGPAGKYLVELQWHLLPSLYAVDLRTDDLFARAQRAEIAGHELPALSSEDLLLVLCLHAGKHLWTRLLWVCDVANALRSLHIDWDRFFQRAEALGVRRFVGISFWLASNVLEVDLPTRALAAIGNDRQVAILGQKFALRMAEGHGYDLESSEYFRKILALRERRTDQLRYLWRLVFTPTAGDLAAVSLPKPLSPLYRLVRISRLIKKLI